MLLFFFFSICHYSHLFLSCWWWLWWLNWRLSHIECLIVTSCTKCERVVWMNWANVTIGVSSQIRSTSSQLYHFFCLSHSLVTPSYQFGVLRVPWLQSSGAIGKQHSKCTKGIFRFDQPNSTLPGSQYCSVPTRELFNITAI